MPKIIAPGAGECELAAGMVLTADGHQVTFAERDSTAPPDTPQQARDSCPPAAEWTGSGRAISGGPAPAADHAGQLLAADPDRCLTD
jgi:hypothetical protein